jgi:transcriptional regulator with XRE-family HTH domain
MGVIAFFFFFPRSEFSERLTHAMENRSINYEKLSVQIGVSPITVKRWIHGTFEPRHKNLPKIAHALSVSADYLCGIAN